MNIAFVTKDLDLEVGVEIEGIEGIEEIEEEAETEDIKKFF
jgi:hypothetical protein